MGKYEYEESEDEILMKNVRHGMWAIAFTIAFIAASVSYVNSRVHPPAKLSDLQVALEGLTTTVQDIEREIATHEASNIPRHIITACPIHKGLYEALYNAHRARASFALKIQEKNFEKIVEAGD